MKLLYFVASSTPTEDEKNEAAKLGASMRVASMISPLDPVEECDAAYGLVPESYARFIRIHEPATLPKPATPAKTKVEK